MTDPLHPTNDDWELFDPEIYPPPQGVSLLLINNGGVLIIGQWYDGAIAWGYKPQIPATVKARLTQKQQQRENENATRRKQANRQMDLGLQGP
jgi:hypothetical protein